MAKKKVWVVDEIDKNNWMIKGRGAAMFKEKLNILNSTKTYILADESKFVEKLCTSHPIPVECYKEACNYVKSELIKLGANQVSLRPAKGKDGPIITENGNFILDTKFDVINKDLEKNIKSISGVLDSGLFIGYDIEIIKYECRSGRAADRRKCSGSDGRGFCL